MLMVDKNQIKVSFLSIKYALMREMLNKATFLTNIIFMILNNSTFIVQYMVLFSLKEDVGGYSFNQVLLLWSLAAGTFGFAHFFFKKAFSLSEIITNGKLDSFIVQPKNVLLMAITADIETSAIGDIIFALVLFCVSGFTLQKLGLFFLFSICGGLIMVALAVILASLSFWIARSETIADTVNNMVTMIATYPEGIFGDITKIIFYTVLPIGFASYIPVQVITEFNWVSFLEVIGFTIFIVLLAYFIFYRGL